MLTTLFKYRQKFIYESTIKSFNLVSSLLIDGSTYIDEL